MIDRFKFRAWNRLTGKYIPDIQDRDLVEGGLCDDDRFFDNYIYYDSDFVIEQCTGLQDKNGRLIYEGDIIELTRARRYLNRGDKLLVKYDTDRYCGFGFDGGYALTKKCAENCIVIGNIHENPGLLEGK